MEPVYPKHRNISSSNDLFELYDAYAEVGTFPSNNKYIIMYAIAKNDLALFEKTLAQCKAKEMDEFDDDPFIKPNDWMRYTMLEFACMYQRLPMVIALMEQSASTDSLIYDAKCIRKSLTFDCEYLPLLIQAGANIGIQASDYGWLDSIQYYLYELHDNESEQETRQLKSCMQLLEQTMGYQPYNPPTHYIFLQAVAASMERIMRL